MYVELSDEVCCNIVTVNKHISISSAEYNVPWPSTVIMLKLNFQPNNRFVIKLSVF